MSLEEHLVDELFAAIKDGDEARLLAALSRGASPDSTQCYHTGIRRIKSRDRG